MRAGLRYSTSNGVYLSEIFYEFRTNYPLGTPDELLAMIDSHAKIIADKKAEESLIGFYTVTSPDEQKRFLELLKSKGANIEGVQKLLGLLAPKQTN
jgi:hypothetical protein